MAEYEVTIVNPRRKASMAKAKRDPKTGQYKKTASSNRRRRRRNPSTTTAVARRTSNPAKRRAPAAASRRRRRNPSGGGGGSGVTLASGTQDLLKVILSRALLAWAIKTFGKSWGVSAISGAPIAASPYAGQAWPLKNYAGALAIGFALAKMLGKMKGGNFARIFWQTTVRDVATRFIWTEGIGRIPGAASYMGDAPGTVWRPEGGNTFELDQWNRWQAMQGTLETARPMDGTLEMKRPMDGLTGARSIDQAGGGYGPRVRYRTGRARPRRHMGHLLPGDVNPQLSIRGSYTGSGYKDPYNAVYGAQ